MAKNTAEILVMLAYSLHFMLIDTSIDTARGQVTGYKLIYANFECDVVIF